VEGFRSYIKDSIIKYGEGEGESEDTWEGEEVAGEEESEPLPEGFSIVEESSLSEEELINKKEGEEEEHYGS
jgi:hypothetical protein